MAHQVNPEAVINRLAIRVGQLTAENAMLETALAELQEHLDKLEGQLADRQVPAEEAELPPDADPPRDRTLTSATSAPAA